MSGLGASSIALASVSAPMEPGDIPADDDGDLFVVLKGGKTLPLRNRNGHYTNVDDIGDLPGANPVQPVRVLTVSIS